MEEPIPERCDRGCTSVGIEGLEDSNLQKILPFRGGGWFESQKNGPSSRKNDMNIQQNSIDKTLSITCRLKDILHQVESIPNFMRSVTSACFFP